MLENCKGRGNVLMSYNWSLFYASQFSPSMSITCASASSFLGETVRLEETEVGPSYKEKQGD